ncbi:restriction endonuclease [Candidatus Bathyarchaeota archaeon]|nr:restriction endonuclease [Candidatus Bathyarchaeota archaeon]
MSNFCPNCGTKLGVPNPNFCPNCGTDLRKRRGEIPMQVNEYEEARVQATIHELGEKLEECVEKILASKGYHTQRRVRMKGISGAEKEIDIIATKGNKIIAVECKNWKNPVGVDEIEKFWAKLKDLGPQWHGIFVAYPGGFTEEAEKYADYYNIDRWDTDFLKEEFWAINMGRAEYVSVEKGIMIKNALPLKVNFLDASKIGLQNKEKIKAYGMLSYHPYYVIAYSYFAKVKDPTKKVHTFRDSGKVLIDGLDGTVLNPAPIKGVQTITKALKTVVSKEEREESKRNKKLMEELENSVSIKEYEVRAGESYKVRVLQPSISYRSINKSALEYIVQKNTEVIRYTPKTSGDDFFPEVKTKTYVPKVKNINIKGRTLVFVPRWDITFEAPNNKIYSREVLAFSGTVLEDTLKYCPKHIGLLKKETFAICEVCGLALCDAHVFQCAICGKWLCEDDGVRCEGCERIYCKDHNLSTCTVCGSVICEDCKLICPICGKTYSKKHAQVCNNCGKSVCPDCTTKVGLIRKKIFCKKCQPE